MKRFAMLIFLMGCGSVRSADHAGDPIAVIKVDLQGMTLPAAEGEHRARFGWSSVGGGPMVDCLAEKSTIQCLRQPAPEIRLVHFDVPLMQVSLSSLEVPLWELPKEEDLFSYDGALLALGGMAIYDDRNMNGQLDLIPQGATEPIDLVLAESIATELRSLVVFQQGEQHPYWSLLEDVVDCPPAPQGISVGRLDENNKCTINRTNALLVTTSSENAIDRILCLGSGPQPGQLQGSRYPDTPPSINATVVCNADHTIMVFYDNQGKFCDRFKTRTYDLVDCDSLGVCWDLRDNVPKWWNEHCPL